jgi:hypothetical protein
VLRQKRLGLERSPGSRIVTHADDLVILCRTLKAEEALRQTPVADTHGDTRSPRRAAPHGSHTLRMPTFYGDQAIL